MAARDATRTVRQRVSHHRRLDRRYVLALGSDCPYNLPIRLTTPLGAASSWMIGRPKGRRGNPPPSCPVFFSFLFLCPLVLACPSPPATCTPLYRQIKHYFCPHQNRLLTKTPNKNILNVHIKITVRSALPCFRGGKAIMQIGCGTVCFPKTAARRSDASHRPSGV